jgi:hypothetical protein
MRTGRALTGCAMNAKFPILLAWLAMTLGMSPAWPDSLPAAPAQYASGQTHVRVLYLRKDGKNLLFEQALGSTSAASLPLSDLLDMVLKTTAREVKTKDLLFLADPERSTADANRAITAARNAGFTVYQSPPLKPEQ